MRKNIPSSATEAGGRAAETAGEFAQEPTQRLLVKAGGVVKKIFIIGTGYFIPSLVSLSLLWVSCARRPANVSAALPPASVALDGHVTKLTIMVYR